MQLFLELEQDTIPPFPLHNMALATPSPTPTLLCRGFHSIGIIGINSVLGW